MLTMPLEFNGKQGNLEGEIGLSKQDKTLTAEVIYTDIPSAALQALFPTQHWMNAISMPLSGWAHAISDFNANVRILDFMAEAGAGTVDYPSQFSEPLALQRIHVSGSLSDGLSTLTVKEGLLDFKKFKISFNGSAHKQGEDYGIDASAETANVPVDEVHRYWPLGLSPHSREWVITHISKGMLTKASVAVHFKPGELKLKDTPKQAIDATLNVKGATVKYMPTHPAVTGVDAQIKFTGNSMDAAVSHGDYLTDSRVTSASVRFPDLNPADVRLFLDMNIEASAKDVVTFMSLPDLNKAKRLNLTDEITGRAAGNAKLDFIAFSEHDDERSASDIHINYAIVANLLDVTQPAFMHKHDVANANMKITLNNKGVKAAGNASINQLPMAIDLSTGFGRTNETSYAVKLDMPVARLPDFGLPKLDVIKGALGVDAKFTDSDDESKADAALDLTRTSIELPEYGFSKKMGEQAMLNITTQGFTGGNTFIKSFFLKGTGYSMSGKAEIEKGSGDFSSLSFDSLHFKNNDLDKLDYVRIKNGARLSARGRALDVSPYIGKGKSKSSSYVYDLDIKADRLILGDAREFKNTSVRADCAEQCRSVAINAALPSGILFTYAIADGTLSAACDNAGELLRVLGIFSSIEGGKMTIDGKYVDNKLQGQVLMTDYVLKNAPVLTKMFTIASLTGILDTLTGNGIAFTKLSAPFVYAHDVIMLKQAKTHGSALGVTSDGTIDLNNSTFDLKGVLVPSYMINSLIGNVPLIGELLVGGTGKGLIALNYSVKGDMSDPSVSVNPLSALTPGFLRGVFNIFDKPAPDLDKIQADKQKEEEAKAKSDKDKKEIIPDKQVAPATSPGETAPGALPSITPLTAPAP